MNKVAITLLLLLYLLINYKLIVLFKNKYYITKKNKHLQLIRIFVILLTVVPYFVVYKVIPESLNNTFNVLISMVTLLFTWLMLPKE